MLNIRAGNANEFHSLVEELSELPELKNYFPAGPAASGSAGTEAAAVEEPTSAESESASTLPAAQTSGAKSALEIARERMKGVKS